MTNHHGGAAAGGPSPAAGAADNINVSNPFDDVSPSPPPRPPAGTQYTSGPHPPFGQSGPPRPQGMHAPFHCTIYLLLLLFLFLLVVLCCRKLLQLCSVMMCAYVCRLYVSNLTIH